MRTVISWGLFLAFLGAVFGGYYNYAPTHHNLLKPFDIAAPIGVATHAQIMRLFNDEEFCLASLNAAEISYLHVEDSPRGQDCAQDNVILWQSGDFRGPPVQQTCAQAAALYVWREHVAEPAAMEFFGQPLKQIETMGSFSCRRQVGNGSGLWSEHAFSNAIDISGFTLADGTHVTVEHDWGATGDGQPASDFLETVFGGACEVFSVALGPNYNAAHYNHFHFDLGNGSVCQ